MKPARLLAVAIVGAALFAGAPLAQSVPAELAKYDPSTEVTLKGTIAGVQASSCKSCPGGLHLDVNVDDAKVEVHVGPTDFVAQRNFWFFLDDAVEVVGSKVRQGGVDVLLAREIKKGDKTLTLRDAQGVPEWSKVKP